MNILFVILTGLCGFFIFDHIFLIKGLSLLGILFGVGAGYFTVKLERKLAEISLRRILGGLGGGVVGLILSHLFVSKILSSFIKNDILIYVFFYLIGAYLGVKIGAKKGEDFSFSKSSFGESLEKKAKILDTSAIIDGRIADICETGFIEGTLIIPQFVLYEIQHIADQQDPVRRARGRRGLDILHRLQKQNFVEVKILDQDFTQFQDVDSKLVALAKRLNGKLITNDYNLNKVAELQGIEVLNINQLSMALRPSVLPGEQMSLKILREGKEHRQGIGYLDDGTMVVVDDAKKFLGRQVEVIVTSVLQTTSGRMIFAKLKEEAEKEFYFPEEIKYEEGAR